MNNKFACKGSKTNLHFTMNQCKKGVLFILKSDKIDRFYV